MEYRQRVWEYRQATLAYLCGVSTRDIQLTWSISDRKLQDIVYRLAPSWNEPLVEFYRANGQNKAKNAVHFFLSAKGADDLPHADLARDEQSYRSLGRTIDSLFVPREKKLIQDTGLENFFDINPKINVPVTYHKLLQQVFGTSGYSRAMEFVEPMIDKALKDAYNQNKKIDLNEIYKRLAEEISSALKLGTYALQNLQARTSTDFEYVRRIEEALRTLSLREEKVLRMRFGIGGPKYPTLKAIGDTDEFVISPERIRQIQNKGLRKLRHPKRGLRELTHT